MGADHCTERPNFGSELIVAEYVALYGLRAVINRSGVLTGPWQMDKVDQGFVALWAARHLLAERCPTTGSAGLVCGS
jgi:CDP-paratose 2-epimerase